MPPKVQQQKRRDDVDLPAWRRTPRKFREVLDDEQQNGLSWFHLMDYMRDFKKSHPFDENTLNPRYLPEALKILAEDNKDADRSQQAIAAYAAYRRRNLPERKTGEIIPYPVKLTSRQQNTLSPLDLWDYSNSGHREDKFGGPEFKRNELKDGLAQLDSRAFAAYRRTYPPNPRQQPRQFFRALDARQQATLSEEDLNMYCRTFQCGPGSDDYAGLSLEDKKAIQEIRIGGPSDDDAAGLSAKGFLRDSTIRKVIEEMNSVAPDRNTRHIMPPEVFTSLKNVQSGYATIGYQPYAKYFENNRVRFVDLNLLLAPVNIGNYHWILLVANLRRNVVVLIDSMPKSNPPLNLANDMANFINDERRKLQLPSQPMQIGAYSEIPQQRDGFNCGIYALMYAQLIMEGRALHKTVFDGNDANETRKSYYQILVTGAENALHASIVKMRNRLRRRVGGSTKRPVLRKGNHHRYKRG